MNLLALAAMMGMIKVNTQPYSTRKINMKYSHTIHFGYPNPPKYLEAKAGMPPLIVL